jgi:DNA polymerase-3 subunit beta
MRFTVLRTILAQHLAVLCAIIPSRCPKPILGCVKFAATGGKLTLSATDLELAACITVPEVDITEDGQAVVNAKDLRAILAKAADEVVVLDTEPDHLNIRFADARFQLPCDLPADFPPVPQSTGDTDFAVSSLSLARLIHQTRYAVARQSGRYANNGILLERAGRRLALAATDGYRAAVAHDDCLAAGHSKQSALIAPKALQVLLKLLGRTDHVVNVQVQAAEKRVLFTTGTTVLASVIMEGNFPPYRDIIPHDHDKKAVLLTEAVTRAFERAVLLAERDVALNNTCVKLAFQSDGLTISSTRPGMGDAKIKVDLQHYEGEPLELGVPPQHILDALRGLHTQEVTFTLRAANKPVVITTGVDFTYVVMPSKLPEPPQPQAAKAPEPEIEAAAAVA